MIRTVLGALVGAVSAICLAAGLHMSWLASVGLGLLLGYVCTTLGGIRDRQ